MKIVKKIHVALLSLVAIAAIGTSVGTPAYAINVFGGCSGSNASSSVCSASKTDSVTPLFQKIISLLLYIIGIISILMIVIGGIKYVTSNGDSNNISSAKNTVQYAVVGLIVAVLGQAIVLFVVNWLK